jgi:hypothetical protein
MKGVNTPSVPSNIPSVNPIDDSLISFMQQFAPAKSAKTSADAALMKLSRVTTDNYQNSYLWENRKYLLYGSAPYNKYLNMKSIVDSYTPYKSAYDSGITQYNTSVKPTIDTYNNEVSAYKAVVDPYKDQVAAYNQERETRAADYNKYAIDPALVSKEHNASTGEQLGASDLYSDHLHTMMLDKVSAANFEPEQDQVSSMFVGGKK